MKFGTWFDASGEFFDTVHFPQSQQHYPLRGAGLYLIEGRVVSGLGGPSLEVVRRAKMLLKGAPRSD